MLLEIAEVLLSLSACRCTQSFIIFYSPATLLIRFPSLIIHLRVEIYHVVALLAFYDWSDELLKKALDFAKGWPKCLKEVED